MKIIAITQARRNSSRLPNKILLEIDHQSILQIHLERILKSNYIDKLIIATTKNPLDDVIESFKQKDKIDIFRGDENNVLERFYQAVKTEKPDLIVRLTSDCPLVDPIIIDQIIQKTIELNVDYCSNTLKPTFPDGFDVEVFKFTALEKAYQQAELNSEKEHVTPFIWKNSTFFNASLFTSYNFENDSDKSQLRLTLDEEKDFILLKKVIEGLGTDKSCKEYVAFIEENQLQGINQTITRNEGFKKSVKND